MQLKILEGVLTESLFRLSHGQGLLGVANWGVHGLEEVQLSLG